jgi:general secretion pathway protein G
MKTSKNAFTMIEIVFVIVVLAILASVAIPRFSATRVDAQITKGRADVASIRLAIVNERQRRLIKGDSAWITQLHGLNTGYYFDGVDANHTLLMYGIKAEDKNGHWHGQSGLTYKFKLEDADNVFTYDPNNGTFLCTSGTRCSDLTD